MSDPRASVEYMFDTDRPGSVFASALPPADVARWIRDWGRVRNGEDPRPEQAPAGPGATEGAAPIPSLVPQIEK